MYKAIFENTGIAMVIIEEDMSISLINDEFSKLSGFTREDIEGKKSWTAFFSKYDLYRMEEYNRLRLTDPDAPLKNYEAQFINKDGKIKDIVINVNTIPGTSKNIASLTDITACKQAEELYYSLANSLQIGVYIIQDGTIVFVNPHYPGYSTEELLGSDILSYVHPEDREMVKENAIRMIKGEQSSPYEYRITDRNGQVRWLMECVVPICYRGEQAILGNTMDITEIKETREKLENQKILESSILTGKRIVTTFEDITERKQAEEALGISEERYRAVIDNIAIGVSLISPDMEILELNSQMRKWFPRADVSARPICYRTFNDPPRETICSYCPTYLTLQDGEVHESITETPARDEIRNYRIISSPIKDKAGNVTAAIEMVEDITEDMEIRERLSRSERLYRTLFETTGAATVIVDNDTKILMTNAEFEKLTCYTKQEVDGKKKWTEFVEKCDLERMKGYHKLRRINPNAPPKIYEFTLTDRYGNKKEILATVAIIPGTKRSIASLLDITHLKRLDEEIRGSEAKYRLLAENISDIIWTTDTNLKLTYISPSVEKLRGYSADEAIKQPLEQILTPASYKTAMNAFREAMAREGVKRGDLEEPTTLELEMIRKDGSTIWAEVNMTFLRDSDGRIEEILGVTRDITQRKQTEEELELKTRHLEETNIALKVLLKHRETDKEELQENILSNVRELIIPYIEKAKTCKYKSDQENYLSILETNLNNITSPFLRNLSLNQFKLTPKEIQIANLIKEGKTTQEIADLLYLSLRTINFHRENIRKKLGLTNKKANLQSHLSSLS